MQRRPLIPRNPNDLEYLNETISSIHDDNLKVISTVSYLENYITHQLGQAINECINICTITNQNNHDIHEFITRQEQKMDQLIDITKQNMQLNNVIINRQSEILQTLNATITEFRNASAIKHSPIRSTLFNQTEAIPSLLSSATNTEERYTPYNTNPKTNSPSSKHQSNNYPKEVSYDKNSNLIQITHYDCNILERIKSKSQATSICNSNADPSRILCATYESEQLRMEILSSSNFNGYPSSLYQTKILDQPPLNPIARRLCDVFFAAKRTALTQLRPITTPPENITPLRISSSIEQILDTIDIINRYSNSGFMNDTNNLFDSTTISLIESRTDLPITSMSPFLIIELFFYLWTENFTNNTTFEQAINIIGKGFKYERYMESVIRYCFCSRMFSGGCIAWDRGSLICLRALTRFIRDFVVQGDWFIFDCTGGWFVWERGWLICLRALIRCIWIFVIQGKGSFLISS